MRGLAAFAALAFCIVLADRADAGLREASESYDKGDYAGALAACRAAAEQGDASCQNILGILYSQGHGVRRDDAQAVAWFRRAAEHGNAYAALNLGLAYESGRGVSKSDNEAERWYLIAAERHLPEAQLAVGLIRMRANRDPSDAVKWFRLAARQGLPLGQLALGESYEAGRGIRKDARQAAKWYLAAATSGEGIAQSRLGLLYEEGKGVERDLTQAYFWYAVSALQPDLPDQVRRADQEGMRRLSPRLTRPQIAEADNAAKNFRPGTASAVNVPRSNGAGNAQGGPRIYATGSGFYVTNQGHIMTNNHVVANCTEVRLTAGEKPEPLKILATDADRDLALL